MHAFYRFVILQQDAILSVDLPHVFIDFAFNFGVVVVIYNNIKPNYFPKISITQIRGSITLLGVHR
jgi:hypothetical protein